MLKKFLPICALLLAITACESTPEKPKKEDKKKSSEVEVYQFEEDCTYRIDIGKAQANWTAFKLADKVGVNGTFKSISFDPIKANKPELILEGLQANVHTSSVSTQDEARDKKIVNSFYIY